MIKKEFNENELSDIKARAHKLFVDLGNTLHNKELFLVSCVLKATMDHLEKNSYQIVKKDEPK